MKKLFIFAMLGLFAFTPFYFLLPSTALASGAYVPQTTLEYIAYLQGVVDALKNQKTEVSSSKVVVSTPVVASSVKLASLLEVKSGTSVYAWFQYGTGDLNKSTTRTKVTKNRSDDEFAHQATLKNLAEGTYSYRAVFETRDGKKHYGNVNTFSIGESNSANPITGGGTVVNNSRGSLALSLTTTKVGEYVTVDWSVPERKAVSSNWIGMYTRSADNDEYTAWRSLSDDTSGTTKFFMKESGTYEFRLFYNNSYDDEVTSRTLTVNRK
jgi:hypothetical protein